MATNRFRASITAKTIPEAGRGNSGMEAPLQMTGLDNIIRRWSDL